jgi:hypothetical protein
MRLSTLPTAFGEKLVMRIFDPDTAVKSARPALGFGEPRGERWQQLIASRTASSWSPAHRQRQDDHAVLHAEEAWPPRRSTSAPWKTRSR